MMSILSSPLVNCLAQGHRDNKQQSQNLNASFPSEQRNKIPDSVEPAYKKGT